MSSFHVTLFLKQNFKRGVWKKERRGGGGGNLMRGIRQFPFYSIYFFLCLYDCILNVSCLSGPRICANKWFTKGDNIVCACHGYVMKILNKDGEVLLMLLDVFSPLLPLPLLLLQPLLFLMPYQMLFEGSCRCLHTWNRNEFNNIHSDNWRETELVLW